MSFIYLFYCFYSIYLHTLQTYIQMGQKTYESQHSAAFRKVRRLLQRHVYPYPSHLYNYCTKKCLHFNHLALFTPLQLYSNWLNLFTAVLLWFDSMMTVAYGPIHVKVFSVILQYKYLRNKFEHFVSLVS